MKKQWILSLLVGLLILALVLAKTNPSWENHIVYLLNSPQGLEIMDGRPNPDVPALIEVDAPRYVRNSAALYHNCFLASFTTSKKNGGWISIGFLGMVFDIRGDKTPNH